MAVIKIKLNIAGRQYPLSINEEEEEAIRRAGKEVNDLIKGIEEKYDITDRQDALAMSLIQVASKLSSMKSSEKIEKEILNEKIEKLNLLIEENIK